MLAFIKKKIGLSPDTEEQCNCCNGGSQKTQETTVASCGCGEGSDVPGPSKEISKG